MKINWIEKSYKVQDKNIFNKFNMLIRLYPYRNTVSFYNEIFNDVQQTYKGIDCSGDKLYAEYVVFKHITEKNKTLKEDFYDLPFKGLILSTLIVSFLSTKYSSGVILLIPLLLCTLINLIIYKPYQERIHKAFKQLMSDYDNNYEANLETLIDDVYKLYCKSV